MIGADRFRSAVASERHCRECSGQQDAYGLCSQVFELAVVDPDAAAHARDRLIAARVRRSNELAAATSRAFHAQWHHASPWIDGGDLVLLHAMHASRLQIPIDLIEIGARVEVRTSTVPTKTQRSAVYVLIFDLHVSDASHGRQHLRRLRTNHRDLRRGRYSFHHHRTAHFVPLLQDAAVCACCTEQHVPNTGDPVHAASGVHNVKCDTFTNGKTAREPHT